MTYAETWARQKNRVEQALEVYPFSGAPEKLRSAMRYSLLSGGKRLRGVLALASCEMGGGDWHDAEKLAVAVEMIHAYSLIHDDLPAMDNDTLRRGKPTNHVVYGEAMAILAGDGLLTEAFSVLADIRHPAGGAVLREVARAAGPAGMAGGQALDMEASLADASGVRLIHSLKTGRLITAPMIVWNNPAFFAPSITGAMRMSSFPPRLLKSSSPIFRLPLNTANTIPLLLALCR